MRSEDAAVNCQEMVTTNGDRGFHFALLLSVFLHVLWLVAFPLVAPPTKLPVNSEEKIRVKALSMPKLTPQSITMPTITPASSPARPLQSASRNAATKPTAIAAPDREKVAPVTGPAVPMAGPAADSVAETVAITANSAPAVDLSASIDAFLRRLEERKEYPYMARKRGQEGTVTVRIRIAVDGMLAEANVENSSGIRSLDDAAVQLVRRSCPFHHGTGQELRLVVPIKYGLKEG